LSWFLKTARGGYLCLYFYNSRIKPISQGGEAAVVNGPFKFAYF